MAKADFCFNFYDGDATRDMAHMNRLERGAYMDIIIQQRQRGHLSIEDIKRFLSKDFDTVWGAIEWVMKKAPDGKFFVEWLQNSEVRAKEHSTKQKENRAKAQPNDDQPPTKKKSGGTKKESGRPLVEPLRNGNGYEDVFEDENKNANRIGGKGEMIPDSDFADYELWTQAITDNTDHIWEPMFMNSGLRIPPGRYIGLINDHLQLLARYPKMKPPNQQAFRHSLLKHITENKDKQVANGAVTNKTTNHGDSLIQDYAERHGSKTK